jgi:hypothetical protein
MDMGRIQLGEDGVTAAATNYDNASSAAATLSGRQATGGFTTFCLRGDCHSPDVLQH